MHECMYVCMYAWVIEVPFSTHIPSHLLAARVILYIAFSSYNSLKFYSESQWLAVELSLSLATTV